MNTKWRCLDGKRCTCAGKPVQHGLDERGRRNARQCNGLAGIGGRVIVLAERVLHRVVLHRRSHSSDKILNNKINQSKESTELLGLPIGNDGWGVS